MSIQQNVLQGLSVAGLLLQRSPIAAKHKQAMEVKKQEKITIDKATAMEENLPRGEGRAEALTELADVYNEHFKKTGQREALSMAREYEKQARYTQRRQEKSKIAEQERATAAAAEAQEARRREQRSADIRAMILEGAPSFGVEPREVLRYGEK